MNDTYYIARVKKPHRKFNAGDILVGDLRDGEATQLVCWGWSSKLNVFMRRYYMRYQGWTMWRDDNDDWHDKCTKAGHITILGKFECDYNRLINLLDEPNAIKDRDGFIRQLSLFGGNLSEMVKAAAVHPCMRS